MLLDDDHRAVQDAVRAYVQDRIAPHAARWDREHHFPRDELRGLAALGCYGVAVPDEYGGAGLDYLALALVLEEIAAGDGAHQHRRQRQQLPGLLDPDGATATLRRRSKWLKPLARGEHARRVLPDRAACRLARPAG